MELPKYIAPSPYDNNPTEAIHNRQTIEPDSLPSTAATTIDHLHHGHNDDPTFHRIESLFDPRHPSAIQLFDPALIEREQLREDLTQYPYDADDLANIDGGTDPHFKALVDARATLDEKTQPLTTRFMMDGPVRRRLKRERTVAQENFENARDTYVDTQLPSEESISTLARLTAARAAFAEASYDARQGRLGNNKQTRQSYDDAEKAYTTARDLYFSELWLTHADALTTRAQMQFMNSLKDHERGALAGEQANTYLSEVNDEGKKSHFQKLTERYNKLSRTQKIIAGAGAVAIAGVGFGAIGGFAAAGGVTAVKFGRHFLNGEAARREHLSDERIQQENSVLYAGTFDESQAEHQQIIDRRKRKDQLFNELQSSHAERSKLATVSESDRITKERRKVLGKAAVLSLLPVAGGALGALAEHFVPVLSRGLFRERGLFGLNRSVPHDPQPFLPDDGGVDSNADTPATSPDPSPPETSMPAPLEAPTVNPHQQYLYDTFAGKTLTLNVSPGSNIWEEISTIVSEQKPTLSYFEHERITDNIVQELLRQNPTIKPEFVSVGQQFTVNIAP